MLSSTERCSTLVELPNRKHVALFERKLTLSSEKVYSTICPSDKSFLVITHYQRLLNYIVPDFVHVLVGGKIVKSGDKTLALELESKGYSWLEN